MTTKKTAQAQGSDSNSFVNPIIPLDIYNLDGFANQTYRAENDVAMLEIQVAALANKLTEVIDLLNKDPEAKNG